MGEAREGVRPLRRYGEARSRSASLRLEIRKSVDRVIVLAEAISKRQLVVDFDPARSRIMPPDLRKNVGISVVAITRIGAFMP